MTTTKSNNVMNTVANLSTACIKLFNLVKVAKAGKVAVAQAAASVGTLADSVEEMRQWISEAALAAY